MTDIGTVRVKEGVVFHPQTLHKPHMMAMIFVVKFTAPAGYDPTITSGIDGTHKPRSGDISKHYFGDALDWRIRDFPHSLAIWVYRIQQKLGSEYYVELEPDHIHIQWNG